jgi:23S rRNA A2030 N6-methylase RlmJ
LLVRLLLALGRKDKPYFYLDTHARDRTLRPDASMGAELDEFRDGIERSGNAHRYLI